VRLLRPPGEGRDVTELMRPTHLLDELTANGGLTSPNITYDQVEAVGTMLADIRRKVQFAMGDWLVLVEERFPEEFSQAAEVLKISPGGLQDYIRVARKVPRSMRRPELAWSLHRAVAALEPPEQKRMLEVAVREGLSHHELRQRLKPAELEPIRVCGECGRPL
jgi:hypothetical protein